MFPTYEIPGRGDPFIGKIWDAQLAQTSNAELSAEKRTTLAVEIPLIILAASIVALRIYSRLKLKRKLAVDDILIICATACAVVRTVFSCMSANDDPTFDKEGPEEVSELPYYQHIFMRRIAYICAVTLVRLSILAYYLRLFPPQITTLRRMSIILIVLTLAQFIEILTLLCIFCDNIYKLWSKNWMDFSGSQCFSSPRYSYGAAIGDTVLDCLIFALPIPYVWRLSKLKARQRIGLVVIFGLGFIVCLVALLQIPFIRKRADNSNYFGGAINLLVSIQISLAIVAASLPDLRALIARTFPKFSPLHHRSLVTAAASAIRGRGHNQSGSREEGNPEPGSSGDGVQEKRRELNAPRMFKRPDWLRDSLPASLMGTQITRTEVTRVLSRESAGLPTRQPLEKSEISHAPGAIGR